MNAAFLLVTTAWFAGADPAPATTAAPAASAAGAVASAPIAGAVGTGIGTGGCCGGAGYGGAAYGGGYGGGCGCGCEVQCCKPSCMQRLKARMHRNNCCECCNTCNTCATTSCCNTGCGGGNVGCGGGNVGCCGGNYGGNYSGVSCGCGSCCETCCKPSLCQRLKARMHRNNCCNTCCETGCGCGGGAYGAGYGGAVIGGAGIGSTGIGGAAIPGAMPGAEPIKTLPKEGTPGKKLPAGNNNKGAVQSEGLDVTPTSSSNVIETETKNPFELDRRYETRVNRAADYSWVTGQLYYVHADGGLWVLRYAPLWKEDSNGGSVVLARDRQMDSYREGDLVKVHGEILNQKGSIFLGGPQYRVQSIELIDRSAR